MADKTKVYHISKRSDGKWAIKFAGGEKVIKTFATKEEAMKYKRYKDFISNSRTAYEKAWKYGWLKEYTWLTKGGDKKEDIRTLDDCIKIAKQYKTYAEFMKNESLIYSYCKYKKWNKQIIWGK